MGDIRAVQARGIEVCVPDQLLAIELAGGDPAPEMNHRQQQRTPGLQQLRERMRGPTYGVAMRGEKGWSNRCSGS